MKKLFSILSIFFLLSGCKTTFSEKINENDTRKVLDHHWQAFKQGNLDAVMEDYTEESILILPDGTHEGLDEIREVFIGAFKSYPQGSSSLHLEKSVVEKDVAYIIWTADAPTFTLEHGSDTFLIRDGKIIRQTYTGVTRAK